MIRVRGSLDCNKRIRFGAGSPLKLYWKRIGLTALAGVFVGFAGAAVSRNSFVHPRAQVQTSGLRSDNGSQTAVLDDAAADLTRLETRNRRLEALVMVLRQRVEHQQRSASR